MIHFIAIACPSCRTADPTANMANDGEYQMRSPNCKKCGGDGFLWRDPVKIRGLVTGVRQQRYVTEAGETQPGDMHFSPSPKWADCLMGPRRIARDDKFVATWPQPLDDGQTIVRGAAQLDDNPRLQPTTADEEDRLWYEPKDALWCEDEHGTVYTQNSDFTLGPGALIKWVGTQPPVGTRYVLKYTAYLEWTAWTPPQERIDRNGEDIGPIVFLRARHIALINDSPHLGDEQRTSLLSRIEC